MIQKLLLTFIFLICFLSCNRASNMKFILPKQSSVTSIYSYDFDSKHQYLSLFEIKSGHLIGVLETDSPTKIASILNIIKVKSELWVNIDKAKTNIENGKIYSFLNNKKKIVLLVWLLNDQIVILTEPIDPRNVHWAYRLDQESISLFQKQLFDQ